MADDHLAQVHALVRQDPLLLEPPGLGGVGVCVVMGVPVLRWAWATALSTRSTPGVMPGVSVAHLRMPARTPLSPIPSRISRTNSSVIGSGPPGRGARAARG